MASHYRVGLALVALLAGHATALRVPSSMNRRGAIAVGFAAAAAPHEASARVTAYANQVLNIDMERKTDAPAAAETPLNAAEKKLQEILARTIAEKEKSLGFKFEPDDIAEVETILRNKYCGKAGLFSSMEGGTCKEVVVTAAYCSNDERFSSSSPGCDENAKKMLPSVVTNAFGGAGR